MSLYSKDFLKESSQGADDQNQYYYSMDNATQDSSHQNGFNFSAYGGHGQSQLNQRQGLPQPAASNVFRPTVGQDFPNSIAPQRVAPGFSVQGGLLGGGNMNFPQAIGSNSASSQTGHAVNNRSLLSGSDAGVGISRYGAGNVPYQQSTFGSVTMGLGLGREEESADDFPALPSNGRQEVGVLGSERYTEGNATPSSTMSGANPSLFSPPVSVLNLGASLADKIRGGPVGDPLPPSVVNVNSASGARDSRFGLPGLMEITKAAEKDIYTLTMGMDLTTFGLNLNSPDSLYLSFTSPFSDASQAEPQYSTPQCYNIHPTTLKTEHLSKFHLETLFYMFYQLPRDILQSFAAQELYRRDWRYHGELRLWLKPRTPQELSQAHPNVQFVYFDAKAWEVRLFNAAQVRGNLKAGLVSEDDIRVRVPLPPPIGEPS